MRTVPEKAVPAAGRPVSWRPRSEELGPAGRWEGWRSQADAQFPEKWAENMGGTASG